MAFEVFYLVCVFLGCIGVDLTKAKVGVLKLNLIFNILFCFVVWNNLSRMQLISPISTPLSFRVIYFYVMTGRSRNFFLQSSFLLRGWEIKNELQNNVWFKSMSCQDLLGILICSKARALFLAHAFHNLGLRRCEECDEQIKEVVYGSPPFWVQNCTSLFDMHER